MTDEWGVLNQPGSRADLIQYLVPHGSNAGEWAVRASGTWSNISMIARHLNRKDTP